MEMDLPIEFEDEVDEENEQEFNSNQSKDEMSECVKVIVIAAHALEVTKFNFIHYSIKAT
jgi:hypothetical protein